jgi:hypothetical protein
VRGRKPRLQSTPPVSPACYNGVGVRIGVEAAAEEMAEDCGLSQQLRDGHTLHLRPRPPH